MLQKEIGTPKYGQKVIDLSQKRLHLLQLQAKNKSTEIQDRHTKILDCLREYKDTRIEMIELSEFLDDSSGIEGHLKVTKLTYPPPATFPAFPFDETEMEDEVKRLLEKELNSRCYRLGADD